jgi:hypothetical protein
MDVLKLAILAFLTGGVLLAIAQVSIINSILISGGATAVVMAIAVVHSRRVDRKPADDDQPQGPTIE